jgi:hypothetical protein
MAISTTYSTPDLFIYAPRVFGDLVDDLDSTVQVLVVDHVVRDVLGHARLDLGRLGGAALRSLGSVLAERNECERELSAVVVEDADMF